MANTIKSNSSGKSIDRDLRAILDAMNEDNNGKVLYIRRGELAFEDGEVLFDIIPLE